MCLGGRRRGNRSSSRACVVRRCRAGALCKLCGGAGDRGRGLAPRLRRCWTCGCRGCPAVMAAAYNITRRCLISCFFIGLVRKPLLSLDKFSDERHCTFHRLLPVLAALYVRALVHSARGQGDNGSKALHLNASTWFSLCRFAPLDIKFPNDCTCGY